MADVTGATLGSKEFHGAAVKAVPASMVNLRVRATVKFLGIMDALLNSNHFIFVVQQAAIRFWEFVARGQMMVVPVTLIVNQYGLMALHFSGIQQIELNVCFGVLFTRRFLF